MRAALLAALLALPAAAGAQDAAQSAAREIGLLFDASRGMNIESEELEALRPSEGGDRVVFRGRVVVVQLPTRMVCDWLEAQYPDGGGAPQRITARGGVRITGRETLVRCDEMVYESAACRVTCRGDEQFASITKAEDTLSGREIEFDLCRNTVRVRGGAAIRVGPRPDTAEAEAEAELETEP